MSGLVLRLTLSVRMQLALETIEEQLYLGHIRSPCSYLDGKDSALLFLEGREVGQLYRLMLDNGYRRHGRHLYRPDCGACMECQILRVPVNRFVPGRSQQRVWKRGQRGFHIKIEAASFSTQKLEIYNRYLEYQHHGHDFCEADQYREFFVESFLGPEHTHELQLFVNGRLAGVGIFDTVGDAVSAVYFYFDPDFQNQSPGTYNVLALIEMAREQGLNYLYPGFYIADCAAMSYKNRYFPHELRRIGEPQWQIFQSVDRKKNNPEL